MEAKCDMWMIEIRLQYSMDLLESFCRTWTPADIPRWEEEQGLLFDLLVKNLC